MRTIAITMTYATISSTLPTINKWAMVGGLTARGLQVLQFSFSALVAGVAGLLLLAPVDAPDFKRAWQFLPAVIFLYGSCNINRKLLENVNVGTFVVIRSLTPVTTLLLEWLQGGEESLNTFTPAVRKFQLARLMSLALVCGGAAEFGSAFDAAQLSRTSLLWGSAYLATISLNFTVVKNVIHQSRLTPWGLILYNSALAVLLDAMFGEVFVPIISGQGFDLMEDLRSLEALTVPSTFWPLSVSCATGAIISWTGLQARKAHSPTSFAVIEVATVSISQMVWDEASKTSRGNAGFAAVLLGGYVYHRAATALAAVEVVANPKASTQCRGYLRHAKRMLMVLLLLVVLIVANTLCSSSIEQRLLSTRPNQLHELASRDVVAESSSSVRKFLSPRSSTVIFSCPKGSGHTASANERLALASWARMDPPADYVVIVGTKGSGTRVWVAELSADPSIRSIAMHVELEQDDYAAECVGASVPSVKAIFAKAEAAIPTGSNDKFVYVNSDIILPADFIATSRQIVFEVANRSQKRHGRATAVNTIQELPAARRVVIVGIRTDCSAVDSRSLHNPAQLRARNVTALTKIEAKLPWCTPHWPTGKDYWFFTRGFWDLPDVGGIPNFAIGRSVWDNYLTKLAKLRGHAVDASPVITALHLDHDYSHARSKEATFRGPASLYNKALESTSLARMGIGHEKGSDIQWLEYQACPRACKDNGSYGDGRLYVRRKRQGSFPALQSIANMTIRFSGQCSYAYMFGCAVSGRQAFQPSVWPW